MTDHELLTIIYSKREIDFFREAEIYQDHSHLLIWVLAPTEISHVREDRERERQK